MDDNKSKRFITAYSQLIVCPIHFSERQQWDRLMSEHHYLGFNRLVGESLRYVAKIDRQWVALLAWSTSVLKCKPRDQWIGWTPPIQWQRLHLIANNSRFLILPGHHIPNLASRVLSLNLKRLSADWQLIHGHPILLVETFVDCIRFKGTCYKAANFTFLGVTKGFGKSSKRYYPHGKPKAIFVRPLSKKAVMHLKNPISNIHIKRRTGIMRFTQKQIASLIDVLWSLRDPRRPRGVRHSMLSVLAIAICAVLCGARSYAAIAEFAKLRTQKQLKKLRCRYNHKTHSYLAPSEPTIRRVLQACDAQQVDQCLIGWLGSLCSDDALALDGKTLRGTLNGQSKVHLLSLVTHQEAITLAQKQVDSKTNEITVAKPLLEPVDIKGKVITADAMHTQIELARFIVEEKQADYFFVVKNNQPTIYEDIADIELTKSFPPSGSNNR